METIGLFRTRATRDGAVEVWTKGWRLESQVPAMVPALIAMAFLFSPFPVPVRALGAAALLAGAWIVLRMTRIGFRIDVAGVQVIDVIRTHRVMWDRFEGFVGERNEHEGRCVLVTTDGRRIPSPGTLDPDEMDPFWAQGEVSAVDQLNRLTMRLRRSVTSGSAPSAGGAPVAEEPGDDLSPGARRLRTIAEG
ncbi:MAG TPA: hypothetical protein VG993_10350 [Actinomycetota bacterium]|nr:hypothetical protein [Actinomycetota bacterium]